MKKIIVLITVIATALLLAYPVLLGWFLAAFSDLSLHLLVPLAGIVLVALAGVIASGIVNKRFCKKAVIALSSVIVLIIVLLEGENYYKHSYIPSITISQQDGYQGLYMPFTGSDKLARLDGEATLRLSKDDGLPVVNGATALFPVYCSFVEAVYPSDCGAKDYVGFDTTTVSYKRPTDGMDDIIFVAGPSAEQLEYAREAGVEFNMYPIGYEAFVFIVNRKNPVDSLTVRQIRDIYTGTITNWKDVGGKNQDIRPFQRAAGSGSQTAFLALMGKDAALLPPETHQVSGMDGLIDVVSDYQNHGNAIGYSFRYYVETMKNNRNVKILRLDGAEATRENIRNKTYPVADCFYAVTVKGKESESTIRFIQWILSAQGQELVEKVGYVPLSS